jgi:hypothetical protein
VLVPPTTWNVDEEILSELCDPFAAFDQIEFERPPVPVCTIAQF